MTRRRPMLGVSAALVIAATFAAVPPRLATGAGPAPISFGTPTVVDPIHTNGEPDIGVDPSGRVFVSGPTGTGTQRSTWFGSVDGGRTFRVMAQKVPPASVMGIPGPGPGGGDTDIAFDHTGKQYFVDLYGLACLRTAVTGPNNPGASDTEGVFPAGCAGMPGADRQWLAVLDPPGGVASADLAYKGPFPLAYMEYNNIQTTQTLPSSWVRSVDGINYTAANNSDGNFGADGYPAIDQVTGKVFEAGLNNGDTGSEILLNVGTPDASGNLHFLDDASPRSQSQLIHVADVTSDANDAQFTVLSMDSARNLFIVYNRKSAANPTLRQTFVTAAPPTDGWTHWHTPVQVSAAPSMVSVFPWIKAGGPGRADAVWYGSNITADPSTNVGQSWDVYMSQVVFALDSSNHVLPAGAVTSQQVKVTPHPMHYGDICLIGTNCITQTGNRNLADFFEITVDAQGAAQIVYDDTSNGLIQSPIPPSIPQAADHAGAGVITIAHQSGGPGVLGQSVSGTASTPVSRQLDPAGDALYPVIGGASRPGMDILGSAVHLDTTRNVLQVTTTVADLSNPAGTIAALTQAGDVGTSNLQYVTRWQMGNTVYYAAMETTPANNPVFYAGKAQSIDLCSVSACFPHVITYPEPGVGGSAETGTIACPAHPGPSNPCTLTVTIKLADIGNPGLDSVLEEVGAYAFSATTTEGAENNASAQSDTVPLEIDGVCCYNHTG